MPSVIHLAILVTTVFIAVPQSQYAFAQNKSAGRYTMHPTDTGFLRLDTHTGEVAYCEKEESWTCTPVKDGRSPAASKYVTRLKQENAELQQYVERLEKLLANNGLDRQLANPPKLGATPPGLSLPSEQEIDKALDYFENLLRKFQERVERFKQDKPQEPEAGKSL